MILISLYIEDEVLEDLLRLRQQEQAGEIELPASLLVLIGEIDMWHEEV